jgi:hypothetical protein
VDPFRGGIGFRFRSRLRAEVGYTWRNKANRGKDQSDHILNPNQFFDTKGRAPPKPEHEAHH